MSSDEKARRGLNLLLDQVLISDAEEGLWTNSQLASWTRLVRAGCRCDTGTVAQVAWHHQQPWRAPKVRTQRAERYHFSESHPPFSRLRGDPEHSLRGSRVGSWRSSLQSLGARWVLIGLEEVPPLLSPLTRPLSIPLSDTPSYLRPFGVWVRNMKAGSFPPLLQSCDLAIRGDLAYWHLHEK